MRQTVCVTDSPFDDEVAVLPNLHGSSHVHAVSQCINHMVQSAQLLEKLQVSTISARR